MDENKETRGSSWSDAERWFIELIEQTRINTRRWFLAWIITIIALVGTNMAWLYVFQSYDYVSQENADGINNINTGNQENLTNGETESAFEE